MRRPVVRAFSFALGIVAGFLASCGNEVVPPGCDPCPPPSDYHPLITPDAVLFNLQLACNERNIHEYENILDPEFVFFPASGDVAGGLPDHWGRDVELRYNDRLFDPTYTGPNRCAAIDLDVVFEDGVLWNAFSPPSHPSETWFSGIVAYTFTITIDPATPYMPPPGAEAELVVRNIGTDSDPQWRLVEWTDMVPTNLASQPPRPASIETATWGGVKGFYRFGPFAEPLTTREAVLNNIQAAYNERDIAAYESLLDSDFTFFLFPGDVGGSVPEQWGRADEVLLNSRLFDIDYPGPNRCTNIVFDLAFEDGVQWVELVPDAHPEETWYTTTVRYDFGIDIVPDTHLTPAYGSLAQLTVRNAGSDTAPDWRLVESRDLGSPGATGAVATHPAVKTATWGLIKALYR